MLLRNIRITCVLTDFNEFWVSLRWILGDMSTPMDFMEFDFLGIFTLVTGVLFLILEIRQSNWMWAFQLLSAAAAMVSFFMGGLYASSALNLYYVVMAFVGFVQWRRDSLGVSPACPETTCKSSGTGEVGNGSESAEGEANGIHLRHLNLKTGVVSLAVFVGGTAALFFLLRWLEDPKSVADAGATVLSGVATWWLAKSYPQQWLLWIIADSVSAWICMEQGMTAMSLLYIIYALSAIYGYVHWKRKGKYVDEIG